ncbi:YjgB family protein [Paenibacillus pini]|uniref:Lipoprotein n=1 Tax=Paenibacillus pini JCM 16418 TaxID=1236976 RepID=W7Y6F0_9BACL|nr:YjgB family protein [Paenibacillus pini]GAF06470.1 lipoprotein [Paenibacillus pini JCM 16418]
MNIYKKLITPSIVTGVMFATILSGCGASDTKSASDANSSTSTSLSKPSTDEKNNASKHTSSSEDANATSKDQNTSSSSPNHQAPSTGPSSNHAQQIKDIAALAKQGKVQGAEFVSGVSIIDDIHESWGKPDEESKKLDSYETYSRGGSKGDFAFGVGRGEVVYDIRSFGPTANEDTAFQAITFKEIKKTLGEPSSIRTNSGDDILVYKLIEYELKFVGPHATQRLDHISVYSPRAARPMGG